MYTQQVRWRTVFLSYNHKDETLATHLYSFLESIGVDVWFAPIHCDTNLDRNSLRRKLENEIKKRDLVLVLVTENSLQSWTEQIYRNRHSNNICDSSR